MERPKYTVKNLIELQNIINHAKKYDVEVPVYFVHALGYASFSWEKIIKGDFYLKHENDIDVWSLNDPRNPITSVFCPRDANISVNEQERNHYNDHFLFLNKMHAEDYVALCREKYVGQRDSWAYGHDYDYEEDYNSVYED